MPLSLSAPNFLGLGTPPLPQQQQTMEKQADAANLKAVYSSNPEGHFSWLNTSLLSYLDALFRIGWKRQIQFEDLWELLDEHAAQNTATDFQQAWTAEKKSEKPSLLRALWNVSRKEIILATIFNIIYGCSPFAGPLIIQAILNDFETYQGDSFPLGFTLGIASILCGTYFIGAVTFAISNKYAYFAGVKWRGSIVTSVYTKSLRLSSAARQKSPSGKIVNHVSVDVERMFLFAPQMCTLITAPIQIVVSLILLYNLVGISFLAGVGVLVLMIPINSWIARFLGKVNTKKLQTTDRRIRIVTQILQSIRIIKLYAWEKSFLQRITDVRTNEVKYLQHLQYLQAGLNLLVGVGPIFVLLVVFLLYSLLGNALTAAVIFPGIALLNILRIPFNFLPNVIIMAVNFRVSVARLESFLLLEEIEGLGGVSVTDSDGSPPFAPPSSSSSSSSSSPLPSSVISSSMQKSSHQSHQSHGSSPLSPSSEQDSLPIKPLSTNSTTTTTVACDPISDVIVEVMSSENDADQSTRSTANGQHDDQSPLQSETATDQSCQIPKLDTVIPTVSDAINHTRPIIEYERAHLFFNSEDPNSLRLSKTASSYLSNKGESKPSAFWIAFRAFFGIEADDVDKSESQEAQPFEQASFPRAKTMATTTATTGATTGAMSPESSASNVDSAEPAPATVALNNINVNSSATESGLRDMSVKIYPGQLVMIIGATGSGKSAFLASVLGELFLRSGSAHVRVSPDRIALVPQTAWILNRTVRSNILFEENAGHMSNSAGGKKDSDHKNDGNLDGDEMEMRHLDANGNASKGDEQLRKDRYARVIEACALTTDLKMLPAGDQTEIGEKGINVSGGQKSRISLARAVYKDKDVYILDDPLSAVDAHVSKHLVEKVILGMLRGKTILLATNQLQFLHHADYIIVLKDGRISEQGTYKDLMKSGGEMSQLVESHAGKENEDSDSEIEAKESEEVKAAAQIDGMESKNDPLKSEQQNKSSENDPAPILAPTQAGSGVADDASKTGAAAVAAGAVLVQTETRKQGEIGWEVYRTYIVSIANHHLAFGVFFFTIYLSLTFLTPTTRLFSQIWLALWSSDAFQQNSDQWYLYWFIGISVLAALTQSFREFVYVQASVNPSRNLHDRLLRSVLRGRISFFDATPLGRLVNRFSKDMELIDSLLPISFNTFILIIAFMLVIFGWISAVTQYFVAFLVPAVLIFGWIQNFYLRTGRELKRLESVFASPVFAHFSETLDGISSIRAYHVSGWFSRENRMRLDNHHKAYLTTRLCEEWLKLRLNSLSGIVIFVSVALVILVRMQLTPSLAGITLTMALQIIDYITWITRSRTELDMQMNSVERVKEYIEDIPSEAAYEVPSLTSSTGKSPRRGLHRRRTAQQTDADDGTSSTSPDSNDGETAIAIAPSTVIDGKTEYTVTSPPRNWPSLGAVELRNLTVRYRPNLPAVLSNLSVKINPGEKIGIVGRTGSGKSTMAISLFRLIEADADQMIFIDGVDIRHLALHDLRSRISIIPQEATMFFGVSLRENLDPFCEHSDEALWKVIRLAHLEKVVEAFPEKLSTMVMEGADIFSVGQRQAVCLARALLRNPRVLVLDEATASVDYETDHLIQETIASEFAHATTFTIAHRLNTVMQSDRIMVLDKGKLVEFDAPHILLSDPSSLLSYLVDQAGETSAQHLRNLAAAAHEARFGRGQMADA